MSRILSVFLGVIVLVLSVPQTSEGQEGSWVGKRIMMKREKVKFGHTDDNGLQVYLGTLKFLDYNVLADEGGWLKIRQEGKEGWIDKDEALTIDGAIRYYTAKINNNPTEAHAFGQRAAAWEFKNELDIAIKDYSQAIQLDPSYSWAWENRGEAFFKKKQFDKAIIDFSETIRQNPDGYWAYSYRGIAYIRTKDFDRGVDDLNEAIRLYPASSVSYYRRAQGWRGKKDYQKAGNDLAEAIRLDEKDDDTHNSYAWLLATCPDDSFRDGAKAVESAKKACELTKWKEANCIDTLAAAYAEAGNFDNAVKYQMQALEMAGKETTDDGRKRLKLYKDKKPYRDE